MKHSIAVINKSTVCEDSEVQSYIGPLQTQISEHFAPVWGADATLAFLPHGRQPDASSWWLAVLDNSDQAGALGYHDLTSSGLPLGKVFAKNDKDFGTSVSVTMSHELLEMLGDPGINMTVASSDDRGEPLFFAYEACDACEDDKYGYEIDGVLVSDFVYTNWFGGVAGQQYDRTGHIKEPFQILDGGYIGVWKPNTGWTQVTGSEARGIRHRSRASVGSRRERRRVGRERWARSTAGPSN